MSNRSEHDFLGGLFGVIATAISAAAEGRQPTPGELLGGGLFGVLGSRGPDGLEPATSPNHRAFAHSVTVLTAGGVYGVPAASRFHNKLARGAEAEPDGVRRFLGQMAAGATIGGVAGYGSHLLADATTPKSIPLL